MNKIAISQSMMTDVVACVRDAVHGGIAEAVPARIARLSNLQGQAIQSRMMNSVLCRDGLVNKRNNTSANIARRISDLGLIKSAATQSVHDYGPAKPGSIMIGKIPDLLRGAFRAITNPSTTHIDEDGVFIVSSNSHPVAKAKDAVVGAASGVKHGLIGDLSQEIIAPARHGTQASRDAYEAFAAHTGLYREALKRPDSAAHAILGGAFKHHSTLFDIAEAVAPSGSGFQLPRLPVENQ